MGTDGGGSVGVAIEACGEEQPTNNGGIVNDSIMNNTRMKIGNMSLVTYVIAESNEQLCAMRMNPEYRA